MGASCCDCAKERRTNKLDDTMIRPEIRPHKM